MTLKQKSEYFKKECERFIDFFGLYEWQIYFDSHDGDERAGCLTNSITDNHSGGGMIANIVYNEKWLMNSNLFEISICAFHEVMELMLSTIRYFAINRELYISGREIDDEIHRIIRRLENKVFNLIK